MPATTTTVLTHDQDIDGVTSDVRWAVSSLTYSFPTSAGFYGSNYGAGEPLSNFEALNTVQASTVRSVLRMYAAVANLVFTEVTETSRVHGDLRYAMSDAPDTAWAYYPASASYGGDSWYNNSTGWYDAPAKGNYAYMTFIHETGHALGLKHGHEDGPMTPGHDSMEYSVMTYRSYVGQTVDGGYTNGAWSYAQTPMMYDIAALQAMYGANYATNSGNTTYTWSPTTGEMSINGVAQGPAGANRVFMTLWDGGGEDTYDFSNYTTDLNANLTPGSWSITAQSQLAYLGDGHYAAGNVANALLHDGDLRSIIENVTGGSGNDTLTGNDVSNHIYGNAGADILSGLGGNDFIDGGRGDDVLIGGLGADWLQGGAGFDVARFAGQRTNYSIGTTALATQVTGPDGTDVLHGVERLSFDDVLVRANRAPADFDADGSSDLVWRHSDGTAYVWQFGASGVSGRNFIAVDNATQLVSGRGDYNGDGTSDILWRAADGALYDWQMDNTGGFVRRDLGRIDAQSQVVDARSDRNADGVSDIVTRAASGALSIWQTDADTGLVLRKTSDVSAAWHVAEPGADYNGDGNADVLWRNDDGTVYIWQIDSAWNITGRDYVSTPSTWTLIDGAGDHNGDGTSDLLWRLPGGGVLLWEVNAGAGFRSTLLSFVSDSWQVVDATGDYNGDGKADVLWRNTDGTLYTWQMNGPSVTGRNLTAANPAWSIVDATSDRNADGASDIVWRQPDGTPHVWYSDPVGPFIDKVLGSVSNDWHIVSA